MKVYGWIILGEGVSEKLQTEKGMHSEKCHLPDELQDLFCKRP